MKNIAAGLLLIILTFSMHAQQEAAKPVYTIATVREGVPIGSFNIELFPLIAPKATAYFDSLVAIKFYDSTAFHRVVPGFVIQGGDPNSKHLPRDTWGNGDPSQTNVPAEFSNVSYVRGILGAARDNDPNSANSQFFICVANATNLNGAYTAYGKVVSGMNICDSIVASPRDANDNPLKKIEMFVTKIGMNDTVPTVPTAANPADNANRITPDSSIAWFAVSGAVLYRVEIATDSNFTDKIFSSEIGSSYYQLKNVQLGLKKYYWRVAANNGGHRSAFSSIRSFTTAVSIHAMLQPALGSTNHPANVWLRWSKVFGAASYHLQVSTNSVFTAMVVDQKGIIDTAKQMSGLQLSKKHYWRVSAETAEYETGFGLQSNFSTGTSAGSEEIISLPKEFSLGQNFPNPFNPSTTIEYSVAYRTNVKITMYNVFGQQVATVLHETKDAGSHAAAFNARSLASGLYFYEMLAGNFVSVKKMLLLK